MKANFFKDGWTSIIVCIMVVAWLGFLYEKRAQYNYATSEGCPAYGSISLALVRSEWEQEYFLFSPKRIVILDSNYLGKLHCASCHYTEWRSR